MPPLNLSVNVSENILTAGDSTLTYQWIDCNNGDMPIEGENNQIFIANISGSYAVVLSNGVCMDTSICAIVLTSGITNSINAHSISISPNPVKDNLFIQSDEKIKSIRCVNYLGQSVGLILETNSINTSALTEGMYFLNITTQSEKTLSKRFIKE